MRAAARVPPDACHARQSVGLCLPVHPDNIREATRVAGLRNKSESTRPLQNTRIKIPCSQVEADSHNSVCSLLQ